MGGRHIPLDEKEQRAVQAADYLLEYDWSLAEIAENMSMTKSTVYRLLIFTLKDLNTGQYRASRRRLALHRWNRAGKLW